MWCVITIMIIIGLMAYIIFIKRQIRHIDQQLKKKKKEHSRELFHLQLLDKELNELVVDLNQTFDNEEKFRVDLVKQEREFKDMIANISHDLRTPLTSIKGYLQLIAKDIYARQGEDALKSYLEIVRKHTDELGDLIEHFYEYSYLCDINQEPELSRINLTNLVMDAVAAVLPQMEEKGIVYDLEETIYHVYGNAEMIRRILQNLLRNCLSYAKSQIKIYYSVDIQVVLHVQNDISDTQEIDAAHLFERFYAGNHAMKSTGLGLAIVKMLIQQLGGSATAEILNNNLDIRITFPIK